MSDTAPDTFVCKYFRCMFHGPREAFLIAPDPFNPGDELVACPNCRTTDNVVRACDEPGCGEPVSIGTAVDDQRRYLNLCSEHGLPYITGRKP